MAVYSAVVTNAGRTLFSQAAIGGGQVIPVRITTGDGTLGATDPTTLTSLIHRIQDYSISSSNALVPYQSTYQFLIDSSQVTATYQLREVGLIAKIGTGPETLIYYSYTTGAPDTISPSSGYNATIDFNTLTITFSNTPNTSATLTAAIPPALHAITHLQRTDGTSTDPIPLATTADVGLVPRTPNDPARVLVGTSTVSWGPPPRLVGEVIDFAGASPPQGWLLCDGSAISRATYAALYAVIGNLYGAGDGSTTFNLPDCRGRISLGAGQGTGLTNRGLGSKGGEEAHAISVTEMPVHSHAVYDPGHIHNLIDGGHSHNITQSPHAHSVYDPSHGHSVYDPTHAHSVADPGHSHGLFPIAQEACSKICCSNLGPLWIMWSSGPWQTTYASGTGIGIYASYTGIGIYGAYTGIALYGSNANITINTAGTGITEQSAKTGISNYTAGGGSPASVMQPYLVFNKIIKF